MSEMSKELRERVNAERTPKVSSDKLSMLRSRCEEARDLDCEITDAEERLSALKKRREALLKSELPDMMSEIGVPSLELEAHGNLPAVKVTVTPFFSASIPSSWDVERRTAAFAYLKKKHAEDLIKTEVAVRFPAGSSAQVRDAISKMTNMGLHPEIREQVHHSTLTSWLKERWENGDKDIAADVIGGFIGRVAKIKEVK